MTRGSMRRTAVLVCAAMIAVAGAFIGYRQLYGPMTISAHFGSATGIYPGDQVRIAGVRVGTVTAIEPHADDVILTMGIDHDIAVPADATAVIVAQNLVAARYVQLAPAYEDAGPRMPDGAVIPRERTAVPVEWGQVKDQLIRLANDLGPSATGQGGSVARFIDSTANALNGNGDKLRESLAQLSGVARILAEGSGDIVGFISNLQKFVAALRDSNTQIVQFENRLATLSSVLDGSRTDLDAALTSLSASVGDVQRFIAGTRDKASEQVQRLTNVTQTLVDNKKEVEQLLHIFPTSLSNFYNIYDPVTGTEAGTFGVNNYSNPVAFTCAAFAAAEPGNPGDGVKKCAEYLGPLLRVFNPVSLVNLNYLPFPVNPFLAPDPRPDQLIYSEPDLIPGVVGAQGPPPPPTMSDMLLPAERPSP
jgi:phospholipid/cholesterol/gamma-HCH transport system substrate-binding protein